MNSFRPLSDHVRALRESGGTSLIGRSEEWLRLIETGQLQLDRIRIVIRLAYILRINDLRELIDWPSDHILLPEAPRIDTQNFVRAVLTQPVAGTGTDLRPGTSHDELRSLMERCARTWAQSPSRYSLLMSTLPRALATSWLAFLSAPDPELGAPTARIHMIGSHFLRRVGLSWLACVVGDRAICVGNYLQRTTLAAAGAWHVGHALILLGLPTRACDHLAAAIDRLESETSDDPDRTILRGALQLVQALGATAAGDLPAARQLVSQAAGPASELAADQSAWGIAFGPSEYRLAQLELALEGGDFDEATKLAGHLEAPSECAIADQAAYHLKVAYAFARRNNDIAATFALTKAAALSAEELHYSPYGRSALEHLIRHDNQLVKDDIARLIRNLNAAANPPTPRANW